MMKPNKSKKLSLSTETVRSLRDRELARVAGANGIGTYGGCNSNVCLPSQNAPCQLPSQDQPLICWG